MADLQEVESLARSLMTQHGVGYVTFEFDRGRKRIAATHTYTWREGARPVPVKITFSRHYAELITIAEVHEVMLHEIAHALEPGDGHGDRWKARARKLGIDPNRCYDASERPMPKNLAYCPICEKVVGGYHRKPLRLKWHRGCGRPGTPHGLMQWVDKDTGRKIPFAQMPARYKAEYHKMREKNNG